MMKERDTKEMFVSLFRERAREREFRRGNDGQRVERYEVGEKEVFGYGGDGSHFSFSFSTDKSEQRLFLRENKEQKRLRHQSTLVCFVLVRSGLVTILSGLVSDCFKPNSNPFRLVNSFW